MTTLEKIKEIKTILKVVQPDNIYLINKVKELEKDIINNLPVNYEEI
tara:strand:+ start:200 stop:340 length:141 start_codon:yes stop_codon:yes gene_type:complete